MENLYFHSDAQTLLDRGTPPLQYGLFYATGHPSTPLPTSGVIVSCALGECVRTSRAPRTAHREPPGAQNTASPIATPDRWRPRYRTATPRSGATLAPHSAPGGIAQGGLKTSIASPSSPPARPVARTRYQLSPPSLCLAPPGFQQIAPSYHWTSQAM